MLHRSFSNQLSDYQFVAEKLRNLRGRRRNHKTVTPSKSDTAKVAEMILRAAGSTTYFRLHKLTYLAEYYHVREHGVCLTSSYVIRQKDGPYFTELHIGKLKKAIPNLEIQKLAGSLRLSLRPSGDLFIDADKSDDPPLAFIAEIFARYGSFSDDQLKTAVYMTRPMRAILRREKYAGQNLFNAPIDFSAARTADTPRRLATL